MRKILVMSLLLLITGCALTMQDDKTYQLSSISHQKFASQPSKNNVTVSVPMASATYQDSSLQYISQDYMLGAFVHHAWDAPPSDMLQPLILQSLQNTGYFYAVISAPSSTQTNLRLDTTLIKLQQNFTHKPSTVDMTIVAVLVNEKQFTVIATRNFSVSVPAPADNPYGGVIAANQACQQLMEEMSAWVVQTCRSTPRAS